MNLLISFGICKLRFENYLCLGACDLEFSIRNINFK
jgi:hypothetical protein